MKSNRIDMKESQPQQSVISAENAKYLEEARIPLSLAFVTNSGWPMVLSVWYIYSEGRLWCATQKTAKVVEYLRREPRCAFEVAGEVPPTVVFVDKARSPHTKSSEKDPRKAARTVPEGDSIPTGEATLV